jgi:hypothetical protein
MRAFLAAAAIAIAAPALLAQPQPPAPGPDESRLIYDALDAGRYLEAVDRARAALPRGTRPDRTDHVYSRWLQIHPFIGGTHDPAAVEQGPLEGALDPARAERFRTAEVRDAVREIAARARLTRIVILNEAHDSPRDRAFALEVARALRPLGYRLLAIEALSNYADPAEGERAMAALAHDGFPRLRTGHYLRDPFFADFLRQALALGYEPFAYEEVGPSRPGTMLEQIARREQTQAENLAALLQRHPGERLFVYVGYGHAAEAPVPTPEGPAEWMAARLKRLTGIDPLTIDQTFVDETSARRRAYRDLVAPRLGGRPGILFRSGSPAAEGEFAGVVDLVVIHPPVLLVRGRPDWMRRIGRRPVAIPRRLLPASGRRLIQAFAAGEPADAIPLDQIVVEAGRPAPPLMLPRRRVRWAYQDPVALDPRPAAQ